MNETYVNLAGVIVRILSPFPFVTINGENFLCDPQPYQHTVRFEKVQDIPHLLEGAERRGSTIFSHEFLSPTGQWMRAFLYEDVYYSEVSFPGPQETVCYYISEGILFERAKRGYDMLTYACMENILLENGGLVLHSSHICHDGKGLLFSAPSQTGKSTQAALWEKHVGATVMNGDRSVLRKENGVWHAWGCPMSGTSGINLQGHEPLTAIVMLSQSPVNTVYPLGAAQAFRLLYPQITISNWSGEKAQKAMELLDDLMAQVPVLGYGCNMEPDAVFTLKDALGL